MSQAHNKLHLLPPRWGIALTADDYGVVEKVWISREIADAAMLRRVADHEGPEIVGQNGKRNCAGILFSYYWPGQPSAFNHRIRRDQPDWEEKNGQPKQTAKYLGPPRGSNRLYIPPGVTPEQLADSTIPVAIVEGEKKALALWRLANHETATPRFIPIAIEAIVELLNLPAGWNSYGARPIGPQNAVEAIRLLAKFVGPDTRPPAVVPRVRGGIQLEWHTESIDVEVYIDSPGNVSFFVDQVESGETFEGALAGHEAVLKAWLQHISGK